MGESKHETWTQEELARLATETGERIAAERAAAEAKRSAAWKEAESKRLRLEQAAPLMLEALREGDGDTFAGTLEAVANWMGIRGGGAPDVLRSVDFLRTKASAIRAAIKAATGGET